MTLDAIVHEAVETIAGLNILENVPVIDEDKGDVSKKLEIAVGKQKIAVVVGWNGFTPVAAERPDNDVTRGTVSLVASIFEKPVENRANGNAPHLLDVAAEIGKALNGAAADGMEDVLHLRRISPVSELDRGVISCDVEFSTTTTL